MNSCHGLKVFNNHENTVIAAYNFDKPDTTWQTFQYDKSVRCEWDKDGGRNGTGAIVISGNTLHAKWKKEFKVKANHSYQIMAYTKGEGRTRAHLSINDKYSSDAVYDDFDWTLLSLEYTTDKDQVITVDCNFGYGSGQTIYDGTVWFDDVRIERVD
jgi:hypothetical protein